MYQVNFWYALTIGTALFLGALFMLRMYQQVMLGEPSVNPFRDLSKTETVVFALIIGVLIFFGVYVKPVTDLVSTSLTEIVMYINR